jgi:hypothetical protein
MNAIRTGRLADGEQAAKCHPSFLALVSASLLATVIVLTTLSSRAVLAADDCITEPNHAAALGGHWYYRVDRESAQVLVYRAGRDEGCACRVAQAQSSSEETPRPTFHCRAFRFNWGTHPGSASAIDPNA